MILGNNFEECNNLTLYVFCGKPCECVSLAWTHLCIALFLEETWENEASLYPFTHNPYEVWCVWIANLVQKPKLGSGEKRRQIKIKMWNFTHGLEKDGTPLYQKNEKMKRRKTKKNNEKVVK